MPLFESTHSRVVPSNAMTPSTTTALKDLVMADKAASDQRIVELEDKVSQLQNQLQALTLMLAGTSAAKESSSNVSEVAGKTVVASPKSAVVIGKEAGRYSGDLGSSVLIGTRAGKGGLAEFKDYVAIGADTHPLADNSVTIGGRHDIFSSSKGIVSHADKRDFINPTDLQTGLDFVLKLKPVVAQMNLREDYIDYTGMPIPPFLKEQPPTAPLSDERNPKNKNEWSAYRAAVERWQKECDAPYQNALVKWRKEYMQWKLKNQLSLVTPGTVCAEPDKRAMLFADDLLAVAQILDTDCPAVVDYQALGGHDIKGVRLEEMIPVLVKAIQDLHRYVHSADFSEYTVGAMLQHGIAGKSALRLGYNAARAKLNEEAVSAMKNLNKLENVALPPEK